MRVPVPLPRRLRLGYPAVALLVAVSAGLVWITAAGQPASAAVASMQNVVPAPVSVLPATGTTYTLPSNASILTEAGSAAAADVGTYLAGILRRSTGYPLPVSTASSGDPSNGISLLLSGADASVGQQGYQLDVTASAVVIRAQTGDGLFNGVQTLRQLLPPEIDMPGHTNAALASYAELNCNGVAPPLYTGTDVGFSTLCTSKDIVYTFVDNVLGEIAALTPGPFLHIGGDEASVLSDTQYATFVNRVQPIAVGKGKTVIGWHQIGAAQHSPNRVVQYWGTSTSDSKVSNAVSQGARVVMSPANKAYLDMKYNPQTPLGLSWAGYIEVQTAYEWNPGAYLSGVPASAVLGVEAPLWTETIVTLDNIEYMAFPRLPAIAELGWSPWSTHGWDAFKVRLGAQGPRWTIMGIDFYRSPQVPWAVSTPANRYEAENATISQGVVESNHLGFSGTGFVNYDNLVGSNVQWTVNAASAGTAKLTFRYANGTTTNRPMDITVNGALVADELAFNPTGNWDTWANATVTVNLTAGTNTVRATATTVNGGPNADCLDLQPTSTGPKQMMRR